jgi:hypothetical protein
MNPTPTSPLFAPLLAQVALTGLVWSWMYVTRLASMIRNRVGIEDLRTDAGYDRIRDAENPSDNLINLFEMPVLFFVLLLLLIQEGNTEGFHVRLAWIFVIARTIHSLIHCTINVITLRFAAYLISCLALFGMWVRFGLSVLG